MSTLVRDARGRFAKKPDWDGAESASIYKHTGIPARPPRVWLSHHRLAILGYTGYVILCLLAGTLGGYVGVRVAMHIWPK